MPDTNYAYDVLKAHADKAIEAASDGKPETMLAAEKAVQALEQFDKASKASHRFTSPDSGSPLGHARRNNSATVTGDASGVSYRAIHGLGGRLDNGGFASLGEFLQIVGGGRHDERMMRCVAAGASIGLNVGGGVLVPEGFAADNLFPATEGEVAMPRARVYSIPGDSLNVAGVDLSTNSGGTVGNFSAVWASELGEIDEQDMKFKAVRLGLHKLGILHRASNELISATDYERVLVPTLNAALSDFRDAAFINGDGAGKPLGALQSPSCVEVSKDVGQAAATITYTNLAGMYARLHPACVANAVWVCSPTTIPQLLQCTVTGGTAATFYPILDQSNGQMSIFGRPVVVSSKMQSLGTSGDIALIDWTQYAIGIGRGIAIARSEHHGFSSDSTYWRAVLRIDGQPLWSTAFTPRTGSTLSWSVKLATRA